MSSRNLKGFTKTTFYLVTIEVLFLNAENCYQKDTAFKVVNRDGKAILIFGNIEHEITFFNNTATVVSANLSWDSTHRNCWYDIQGRYRNDSLQLGLSQYLLSPDMYLNELTGNKQ